MDVPPRGFMKCEFELNNKQDNVNAYGCLTFNPCIRHKELSETGAIQQERVQVT